MIRLIKDMQYKLLVFNLSDMYLRVLKVYDTNLSHRFDGMISQDLLYILQINVYNFEPNQSNLGNINELQKVNLMPPWDGKIDFVCICFVITKRI